MSGRTSTCTDTWLLGRAALPAAASSLAITRLSASPCSGISASVRSAMSSAAASSTSSRSGRLIDSASLTTISPPS